MKRSRQRSARVLSVVVFAVFCAAGLFTILAAGPPPDWAQWGGDPQHTGEVGFSGQNLNRIIEDIVYDPFVDEEMAATGGDLLVHGQQFPAFDVHQGRGHDEKLAGDFQIEHPHEIDVFDELSGELREVDLVNIHFLLFNEIKEQVERAFEDLEFNFVFAHGGTVSIYPAQRMVDGTSAAWQRFSRPEKFL